MKATSFTPISIVMTVHDQAPKLSRNLPLLLGMNYEPGFEVIVVDESSTDDTEDVLKQLKATYPHLYTTYIPESSHYLSRRKLALTLGVKAAKNEWIILTEADCHPDNDNWLEVVSEQMTDDVDVVCGYTGYEAGTKATYAYLRMYTWWRQQKRPYRYDGANLAIRKSVFMERNGFQQNLKYRRGEYDFLVNEADCDRITTVKTAEGLLRQEEPTRKSWKSMQLFYMETRRHLHHALWQRMLFAGMQLLRHASYWLVIAALAYSIMIHNTLYIAVLAAILLLLIAQNTFFGYRLTKTYGEHIALWKMPLLDLWVAWHYAHYQLKYLFADKSDFIRK